MLPYPVCPGDTAGRASSSGFQGNRKLAYVASSSFQGNRKLAYVASSFQGNRKLGYMQLHPLQKKGCGYFCPQVLFATPK